MSTRMLRVAGLTSFASLSRTLPMLGGHSLAPLGRVRSLSTSPTSLESPHLVKYHKAIEKNYGPDYADLEIDTKLLLSTLRDLQSWRGLKPNTTGPDYRAGLRAVHLLAGPDPRDKPTLKVADLERVLHRENGVTWRVVDRLLTLGFAPEIESLDDEWKAMVKFNRVHGIGAKRARIFAEHGARTYEDLLASTEKEFGKKISDGQKLALTYADEMEMMMPRAEVEEFEKIFRSALHKLDPTIGFEIMGSYRRGEVVSSDVDMVVWHESADLQARRAQLTARSYPKRVPDETAKRTGPDPSSIMGRVLSAMYQGGLLEPTKMFSKGEKKLCGLSRLPGKPNAIHRQVDIRLCPVDSLPYMLLGNTGDDTLMKKLRLRAMGKGWVLNEYAMGQRQADQTSTWVEPGTEIIVKSEKEIFEKLGLPYLEPTQRSWKYWSSLPEYR